MKAEFTMYCQGIGIGDAMLARISEFHDICQTLQLCLSTTSLLMTTRKTMGIASIHHWNFCFTVA